MLLPRPPRQTLFERATTARGVLAYALLRHLVVDMRKLMSRRSAGWRHPNALARRPATFWIGPFIIANLALLVVAWFLPIMTLTEFWFWSNRVSLWQTVVGLLRQSDLTLFLVVAGFSMIFPTIKLLVAGWIWIRVDAASPRGHRAVRWMEALGKWSMVDVFVVALIVVAVKVSLVTDVGVHAGIYVFTAAIVMSILLMAWIGRALRDGKEQAV